MILVTGATGHFGKHTIDTLLDKGIPAREIAALVRDENKAADLKEKGIHIRIGDYHDFDSLTAAFQGVDKLLLVSSSDLNDRLTQHQNVINAAKESGVKHLVYTSIDIENFQDSAIPLVSQIHLETANYLKASGIAYTLMNNTLYADLVPMFVGEKVLETGIFFPAAEGKTPFVARSEMAEAAAAVLTGVGHENKEYAITAENAYSFAEIAAMIARITGKDVQYYSPEKDAFIAQLVKFGVPDGDAAFVAGFAEAIGKNQFDTHRSDLAEIQGRKPLGLEEFLTGIYRA